MFMADVGSKQLLGIFFVYRDRLFDQHMQSGFQRGDPEVDVAVVRCRNEDGINQARGNHLLKRNERGHIRILCQPGRVVIANCRQLETGDAGKAIPNVPRAHVPQTHNADANRFHAQI